MLQKNSDPLLEQTKKVEAHLIGLPNAGKSTIFNLLTGSNIKVSNYSGITVDVARGELYQEGQNLPIEIVDLPGIYHLNPTSFDEGVSVSQIFSPSHEGVTRQLIIVLDWQRMAASLGLASAILEHTNDNVIILINKDDNHEVDVHYRQTIEQNLGAPVLPFSALEVGPETICHFIEDNLKRHSHRGPSTKGTVPNAIPLTPQGASYLPIGAQALNPDTSAQPLTMTGLENHFTIIEGKEGEEKVANFINEHLVRGRELSGAQSATEKLKRADKTEAIDKVVLHPLFGGVIFLLTFYLLFSSIYTWAGPLMDLTEASVLSLGDLVAGLLPEGLFKSMVIDGIFAGVGGVVIFLPQIMILFFLMSLLEQSGYISRAALIVDRFMSFFGLGGKAFLPYLSGYACAIPGIMAARTIPDPKERYATIMTLPLITCSARIPVYVLLIGTFVPDTKIFGLFNAQALSFFFLYFLGSFVALIMAKIFRLSFFKGKRSQFLIDLPHYQRPSLRVALKQSWYKGRSFLKKAGTIILGLSLIIWLLSSFPQYQVPQGAENNYSEQQLAAKQLEYSTLGKVGHLIEPTIKPLGMDWRIGVGLLVSFGARELFVSAMGTLYALGETDEESESLREKLKSQVDPVTGKPLFDLATAWSIMLFFVFALQCTSTVAILKKESGGWKIPALSFAYMFVLAYGSSFIAYQLLS